MSDDNYTDCDCAVCTASRAENPIRHKMEAALDGTFACMGPLSETEDLAVVLTYMKQQPDTSWQIHTLSSGISDSPQYLEVIRQITALHKAPPSNDDLNRNALEMVSSLCKFILAADPVFFELFVKNFQTVSGAVLQTPAMQTHLAIAKMQRSTHKHMH